LTNKIPPEYQFLPDWMMFFFPKNYWFMIGAGLFNTHANISGTAGSQLGCITITTWYVILLTTSRME
jgi:hypothetical protein